MAGWGWDGPAGQVGERDTPYLATTQSAAISANPLFYDT